MLLDEFDAAGKGTLADFEKLYRGDPCAVDEYTGLSLLSACMIRDVNIEDKLRIAAKLIADGADVNFVDRKYRRTALHWLFFSDFPRPAEYLYDMAKLLMDAGADVNALDKFSVIPLKYAIANTKETTEELVPVYRLLLDAGSDCLHVDAFGKTCLDYAREYNWRTGFLDIVKEHEDGKR